MSKMDKTKKKMLEFVPEKIGPNGFPTGFERNGDWVEWIPDGQDERSGPQPLLLRRGDSSILTAYDELRDKVWWNRHQNWRHNIERGTKTLTKEEKQNFAKACQAARRIERKYGKKNLAWNDFEWGLLSGRFSALAWVFGSEWDESLDS